MSGTLRTLRELWAANRHLGPLSALTGHIARIAAFSETIIEILRLRDLKNRQTNPI